MVHDERPIGNSGQKPHHVFDENDADALYPAATSSTR